MRKEIKIETIKAFTWTCKECKKKIISQSANQIEWNIQQHLRKHQEVKE